MEDEIIIKLSPGEALRLLCFFNEFDLTGPPELEALRETIDKFEKQVYDKMSDEKFEKAKAEIAVAELLGKEPEVKS
jgi:hypothetical protein